MAEKEDYEKLKKKFNLPGFDLLNKEFEISSIDEDFLLRAIRRKIAEKVGGFIKLLETIIQPDTTVSELHECKILDTEKKNEIYKIYKKLNIIYRDATLLSIDSEDKNEAKFINDTFVSWPDIKKSMLLIASKMRDSWKKDIQMHEKLGYLG